MLFAFVRRFSAPLRFLALAVALIAADCAEAQDRTWTSLIDGNFGVGTNWTPSGVPDSNTPVTTIANGTTVQVTNTQNAGTNVTGGQLIVGGNSTLSLLAGGALGFETLVIQNTGTFITANDAWSVGCNNPCITMSGGTFIARSGSNGYFDGFTFTAGTTSTLTNENGGAFKLGAALSNQHVPPGSPSVYTFENGAVWQIGGGLVTFTGTANVTAGTDTGLVILSGGTFRATNPQDPVTGGGLGEITSKVTTTTINAGGTLDFNGIAGTINNLQGEGSLLNGGALISLGGGNFGGNIAGGGGLNLLSGGTTTLSGTNAYTGPTTVNNGATLIVNGSIVSSVDVQGTLRGGTLATAGSVGSIIVSNTIAPGTTPNALGELKVNGAAGFGSSATYQADINLATHQSDRIAATGNASLDGTVFVNVQSLIGPSQTFVLLSAAGISGDMDLAGVTNTVVVSYALSTTSTQLLLGVTVDFTPAGLGLNPNQTAIAEYLEAANTAGGGGLTPLLQSLLGITNPADYRGALDQLSPEIYLQTQTAALYASNDFTSTLLSCRVNGPDTASIIREGQCLWVGARARFTDSDDDFNNLGFTETAGLFSAGAQVALDRDWRLGFGVGYQTGTLEASTGASSDSDQVQGGVVLKYNPGALLLAAAATAGHSWNDVTRLGGSVKGDQDVDVYAGAVRVAYVFGAPGLYLKPSVDASATRLSSDGVDETGNGPANLIIRSGEQTVYTASPTLEIGTEWRWSNGTLVRPFIRGGAIWYEGGDFSADSAFAAAPGGLGTFTIHHDIDDVMGTVAAGVELVNRDNAALRLSYEGQIGEQAEIHSIGLKGSAAF